ncbi:MAG: M48 family metallopeptidase [Campylobacteraceae bacterium]|nr:M48 family metallopeptidase [Campylobacteraceae bacterium]
MRIFHTFLLGFLALILTGCLSTTTQGGALGVNRAQLMMIPAEAMEQGAGEAYAQVLSEAKSKGKLNVDKVTLSRLDTIMKSLVPQTKVFRSDAPSWRWEVNLINEDTLNAWCMPGGKIAFYSGIIEKLALSDDEIAAIMGHEMAHALREHSRERASQDQLRQVSLVIAQELMGASGQVMQLADIATYYTFSLPYSREHEREADSIGVELAARAGYNPRAAVSVWQKMEKLSNGEQLEILSTHPSNKSRIRALEEDSMRVMGLYEKSKSR